MFCLFLRTFGAVLGAALPTIADSGAIECAADSVITNSGQILDAAAADQHHRVFLQIVALAAEWERLKSKDIAVLNAALRHARIKVLRADLAPPYDADQADLE